MITRSRVFSGGRYRRLIRIDSWRGCHIRCRHSRRHRFGGWGGGCRNRHRTARNGGGGWVCSFAQIGGFAAQWCCVTGHYKSPLCCYRLQLSFDLLLGDLLAFSLPSNVSGFVISAIAKSTKRHTCWPLAHVFEECLERIQPAVTNQNGRVCATVIFPF